MKKTLLVLSVLSALAVTGCSRDAQVASRNLSKASDMFQVDRRIVFYNGITSEYMLTIEGKCSIEDSNRQLEVTCKTGFDEYKKHFLGLSDNVTYFAEQTKSVGVSVFRHKVIFKPELIIPDIDLKTS
jgi:hypothetical protein